MFALSCTCIGAQGTDESSVQKLLPGHKPMLHSSLMVALLFCSCIRMCSFAYSELLQISGCTGNA